MATLVETSDEEPTLAVARYIAEIAWSQGGAEIAEPQVARFCEEAESHLVAGRFSQLAYLLLTSADMVLANASEKDLECIFTVICNLVSKAQSPDEALAMADQIATKLTVQPIDKPALRLKILFHLYNMLGISYGRYLIFKRAVKLAVAGKVLELIVPSLKKLDVFLKEWNISTTDKRDLYLSATNVLKDVKGSAKDSYSYLVKYLATFAGEDAVTLSEAKEEAVRAVLEFVKSPDMFHKHRSGDHSFYLSDLLEMPAVRQLEKDLKYSTVFQLLDVFLSGKLESYLDFHSKNQEIHKSLGLVHEDCMTKMRLMSLAGLASKGSGEIPYPVIRETLKVSEDEVEYWVVKAIGSKLLEAKMDQMRQVVIISRCTDRVFGPAQWKDLRNRLQGWKENVGSVLRIVENARAVNASNDPNRGTVPHFG